MADTRPDIPPAAPPPRAGWTGGRITSVVVGAVLVLISLAALAAGGAALWADKTQRVNGYVAFSTGDVHTAGYALTSETLDLSSTWVATSLLGRLRVDATPTGPMKPVFVGIAPSAAAATYLQGVPYATLTGVTHIFGGQHIGYRVHTGSARPASPQSAGIWVAQASGTGTQTVTWRLRTGEWTVVVMNADGSAGVSANAAGGVSAPSLAPIAAGLLAGGAVLIVISVVMIVIPVHRASRPAVRPPGRPPGPGSPAGPGQW